MMATAKGLTKARLAKAEAITRHAYEQLLEIHDRPQGGGCPIETEVVKMDGRYHVRIHVPNHHPGIYIDVTDVA